MECDKYAVTACITNGDFILGVARPGTQDSWGLPGGKIEPNEDPVDAIVRELEEETGLKVEHHNLIPVFERVDEAGYDTTVYMYNGFLNEAPVQGDAGPVEWITWEDLFNGPFGKFNKELKEKLDND